MVDEKKIAFNPAYELSFLKKEEQVDLLDAMDSEQATPSLSQAQRLKKYSQEGHLTLDMMRVIMGEEKKSDLDKITFTTSSCWNSGSASASNSMNAEKGEPMRDISARELKGHNILAVERFQDSTRWMVEFAVRKPRTPYGSPGDEVRLFLTEKRNAVTRKPAICQERNELCVPLERFKRPSVNTANPNMTWKAPRSTG